MFFIWLVMPTNVGKQHLPSRMNRRLCGCDKARCDIGSRWRANLESKCVDHIVPTRSKNVAELDLFDRHPQLHVPRIP